MKLAITPLAICLSLAAGLAMAETNEDPAAFAPGNYFAVNLARVSTAPHAGGQSFDFININIAWGYQFNPYFSAELWASLNAAGETDQVVSSLLEQKVEAAYNAFGAFLVGNLGENPYLISRVGIAGSRFVYSSSGYEDEHEEGFGLAAGLGGGYNFGRLSVEAEYLKMPDVDDPMFSGLSYGSDMITLGVKYPF